MTFIWIVVCVWNGESNHFLEWLRTANTGDCELTGNHKALSMKPAWRPSLGFDQALTRADSGKSSSPCYWALWMFLEVSAPSASDVTEHAVVEPWGIWGSTSCRLWCPSLGALLWARQRAQGSSQGHVAVMAFLGQHLPHPSQWGTLSEVAQPHLEIRCCFICLSSYTINSSILLLCINILSCSICHICTLTSCFPIFNCPQRASSRATPAFLWALICHCPNRRREHLKFSLHDWVVFLQTCD